MSTPADLQAALDAKTAEILNRQELTHDAKRARVSATWKPLAAEKARRDQTAREQHDATISTAKRDCFSFPSPTAADNMAHRQALENIKSMDNPKQVADLLDQAKMSNDPTTVLAVRQHSFNQSGHALADEQWKKVFSDSVKDDPKAFQAAETLIAERSKPILDGVFANMLVPPSILGNATAYEIDRWIAEDPSAAAEVGVK